MTSAKNINLTLKVWRQNGPDDTGRFEDYRADGISTDMSFLEMLDVVNEGLILENEERLRSNPRMGRSLLGLRHIDQKGRQQIQKQANKFLSLLE